MAQVFVSIVSSYVGCCIASVLRHRGYTVVGSVRDAGAYARPLFRDDSLRDKRHHVLCLAFASGADTEDIEALVTQTVDADDEAGSKRLALLSDVVVLCLIEDVRGADRILRELQVSHHETRKTSMLLLLSTTMTWAKTKFVPSASIPPDTSSSRLLSRPATMMAMSRRTSPGMASIPRVASAAVGLSSSPRDNGRSLGTASSKNSGRGNRTATASSFGFSHRRQCETSSQAAMTEDDYALRTPPTGYLEHKRLEVMALALQSATMSTCVVGAGVPYGAGEGLLLRTFRDAWRADESPVPLPTCCAGDNRLSLINVMDLSSAVGNLLGDGERGAFPTAFPKPYILAVEGDGAQCTAKELTSAIARAFGGSGETLPMSRDALEEILIEEPSALRLLMDIRFSNTGGVLAEMVANGSLGTSTWSKGFVASAESLAQDFVSVRSLVPIRAVVLGPPGGDQHSVCEEVSRRHGIARVDAKIAMDAVFVALGKPLPEPLPPEDKVPTPAKAKKGKESKKATAKGGEASTEAQASLAVMSPPERLLYDMQAAFEAADVPFSEYAALDSRGLCCLLPPAVVARAARLHLVGTRRQWSRSGYVLCDIPADAHAGASEIFSHCGSPTRPVSNETEGNDSLTAVDGGSSRGTDQSPGALALVDASQETPTADLNPTHVVYLDASPDFIVSRRRGRLVEGMEEKDDGTKIRGELDRYFAEEGKQQGSDTSIDALTPTKDAVRKEPDSGGDADNTGKREHDTPPNPGRGWLPATAKALRDGYGANIIAVDADVDTSELVDEVDLYLTRGKPPAFIWMLSRDADHEDECENDGDMDGSTREEGKSGSSDDPATGSESIEGDNTRNSVSASSPQGGNGTRDDLSLMEVLAQLSDTDAKEIETRTLRHRHFLTSGVVPYVAAGLVAAAEVRPADPFQFLADHLIRAGKALQTKAEAEAALKYQAGLALLKDIEAMDTHGTTAVYR